ncbi:Endoribonuclease L-PSP/chorismate mutase-like protein [Hypoxylon rubiginosum]|uniref:Endoribonuclease L-PSP/chorismate mutase-like protein n=1 Tax=Hypoxylon rubiginosum TaxID=110542 RepID=A0ACC0D3Q7_9PEZI|nr:Endoribonuclease L-PSP/chorismate mutase-like protein [Hypoxylon rubiginosum]
MSRQLITSEEFPQKPHNCPAVKVPGLIFCSGQVGKGEIKQATTTAITNLGKVLELAGSSLNNVVKFNIYLADMNDFDVMNEAFIAALPPNPPARTCIQAGRLPGGPNSVVEIECIAQV